MADRVVVGNPFENQIGTVAPTATPVDTYVRPVVERSPFESLASTLANLERKAVPALARQEERMAKKEFAEGQRLYEENRIAIGEAVKKGIIAEGESPYVRKGYRVSQMNTMAARYADDLERALETKKLYHSGDPKKIEEFIKTFQADFVKNNGMDGFSDSELSTYFGQPTAKANEAFRSAWQTKHVAYAAAQAYKAFETEVATYTANLFSPDQTPEEHSAALGQLKGFLESRAAGMATDGLDNGKVLDTILTGIGIAVEKTGQTDILDVLGGTKLGTDYAMKSLKVQGKMLDIQAKALTIRTALRTAEDKAEKERQTGFRAEASRAHLAFITDPSPANRAAMDTAIASLEQMGNEESVEQAIKMREAINQFDADETKDFQSSPENLLEYRMAMSEAKTLTEAYAITSSFIGAGKIEKADVASAINDWQNKFDPAKVNEFGLNFYSNATPEGDARSKLLKLILKNEADYEEIDKQARANSLTFEYQTMFLETAIEFQRANGRPMSSIEKMETSRRLFELLSAPIIQEGKY